MNPELSRKLMDAIGARDLILVRELLQAGADPNSLDDEGFSPLLLATDAEGDAFGQTGWSDVEDGPPSGAIVRLLLEAGADPNYADPRGWTALDIAKDTHPNAYALIKSFGGKHWLVSEETL